MKSGADAMVLSELIIVRPGFTRSLDVKLLNMFG